MYPLTPLKIFALDRVQADSCCMMRMNRVINALDRAETDIVWITDENLPDILEELEHLWPPDPVPDGQVRSYTRPLVFTTMDLSRQRPELTPLLECCPDGTSKGVLENIYGHLTKAVDQHPHERDRRENCVCWPTFNLGTMVGCPHGCMYCGQGREGKFLTVTLNLEEYMDRVLVPLIETYPWNKVYRMILHGSDLMSFEPEYGLMDVFTTKLAEYPDLYGAFHTGGANVDWIADLPHKDRVIGVWSTTCETVARELEPGSGPARARVDAGRKCNEMGVPVRYKFKPVIPVKNWREEYADIIKYAVTESRPESIGFCMYIWHTFEQMENTMGLDWLDPEYIVAARDAADEMRNNRRGPFPHALRADTYRFLINEVRRWDKKLPLYVSTETREMWDELKDDLGQDPECYVCGCSSVAVPGGKLALSPGFSKSTYANSPM